MKLPRSPATLSKLKPFLAATASLCLAAGLMPMTAAAQDRGQPAKAAPEVKPKVVWKAPVRQRAVVRPAAATPRPGVAAPRRRQVGPVLVHRRHGPAIYGYGFHYTDAAAARWIAFTAITVALLDRLEEDQIRYHEQAQIEAASAPVGEAIVWNTGGASGSVTTLREGTSESGSTCREFQQVVTIAGQQERAFGTACLQPDESWRIVS